VVLKALQREQKRTTGFIDGLAGQYSTSVSALTSSNDVLLMLFGRAEKPAQQYPFNENKNVIEEFRELLFLFLHRNNK